MLPGLGVAGSGWQAQDLDESRAAGNAQAADAGRGQTVADHVAARLLALLDEVPRYVLADLKNGPVPRAVVTGR